jgi:hypothetical protein
MENSKECCAVNQFRDTFQMFGCERAQLHRYRIKILNFAHTAPLVNGPSTCPEEHHDNMTVTELLSYDPAHNAVRFEADTKQYANSKYHQTYTLSSK